MTSLRLGLLAGLVLPFTLATASLAQPAPDAPPPPPGADAPHRHHEDPAARRAHMADHLRTVLQLTPAQDPALNAFLDAMHPPGGEGMHHQDRDHDQDQALSTPAKLDKMLAHMDEMRTRMATHVAAIKTFYAQLTPAQQKAFDDIAPMLMGGGRHGGDGDHDGMHRHHDGPPGGDGDHAMGPGGPPQG
jgi:hypothetical protein